MRRLATYAALLAFAAGLAGCHGTHFAYRDDHTSIRVGGGHPGHGDYRHRNWRHHHRPWRRHRY